MLELMRSIEGTAVGYAMVAERWPFALMEVVHFVGLAVLVAGIAAFDLRVLGVAPRLPLATVHRFVSLAVAGFALTVVSGALFFLADPVRYGTNPMFGAKMALIVLAGLNAWLFERRWRTQKRAGVPDADIVEGARLACAASLALWTAVIVTGRLLPQFARTF